jgi:hypothetical protein
MLWWRPRMGNYYLINPNIPLIILRHPTSLTAPAAPRECRDVFHGRGRIGNLDRSELRHGRYDLVRARQATRRSPKR